MEKQQREQEQQPPSTYTPDDVSTALTALLWNAVACGALVKNGRHLNERQLRWLAAAILARRDQPRDTLAEYVDQAMRHYGIELRGELVGTTLDARLHPQRIERMVQAVLGDEPPATTGEAYMHGLPHLAGRTCLRLADGRGWWPRQWEDGTWNRSAGSVCLAGHP